MYLQEPMCMQTNVVEGQKRLAMFINLNLAWYGFIFVKSSKIGGGEVIERTYDPPT